MLISIFKSKWNNEKKYRNFKNIITFKEKKKIDGRENGVKKYRNKKIKKI